ncbi:MAG TPA: hypothetical protein ENG90_03800 [Gammaproteobacteria bacterium]|nr:hypothetical protein [Gammaproteobacteria bacterium]
MKACLGLVKSCNAGCESACKPRRASPEAHIYGTVLLAKDRAIRCEARFVAARFRSRRDMAQLIRGSLTLQMILWSSKCRIKQT